MTQIDTAELRNDTDRQVNKYGYAPMSREEMFSIADELDSLRQQLADANKCIAELEALLQPEKTQSERHPNLMWLLRRNRREGD